MAPRYRMSDVEVSRASESHVVVYSKTSAAAATISSQDMAMLSHCRPWLTLEDHAASWCRELEMAPLRSLLAASGPRWATATLGWIRKYAERKRETLAVDPAQLLATVSRLEQFAQQGFLVSAESLIEESRRHSTAAALPPIASVGITTRNRGEVLRRALLSHFENRRRHERTTDYVIIDDTPDSDSENRTRDVLLSLRRENRETIRYADRAARRRFADALIRESGAPPDLVEFALFGLPSFPITTGGARNSLLLATAGDRVVMVDDDSLCRMASCPLGEEGVALSSRPDPTEFWFFPDRERMLQGALFSEIDFLGLHETLLGRGVGECLPDIANAASLELQDAHPSFDSRLRNLGGRVRATMAGVIGDSGIGTTAYLFVDTASQKRLTASESDFLAAVRSRQMLRCVRRTTISEGTSCIAVNLGLDNRSLLAPFIPVQRNSDGLFAQVLRLAFRSSCLGYLPWAVLHEPEKPRQQHLDDYWAKARQLRVPEIVIHVMQAAVGLHDGLGEHIALQRLGEHFIEWGSLGRAEFEHELQKRIWNDAGAILAPPQKSEWPPAGQEFYARYREKYREIVRSRLLEKDYLLPADLQHLGDAEQVSALSREILRRFGELLGGWREMYGAAVSLRAKGVELAPSLGAD